MKIISIFLSVALVTVPGFCYAGDAKNCVAPVGGEFVNGCSVAVTVTWCAGGADGQIACRDGKYSMMEPLSPSGHTPIAPGVTTPYQGLKYGACKGSYTLHAGDEYTYSCD